MPKTVNFQNRYVMENKMKVFTQIIEAELAIRKQINDSISLETNIRRKQSEKTMSPEEEKNLVRSLAKAIVLQEKAENKGSEVLKIAEQ